jgi:gamma-glutamylcyclotransferase (GGCT)/AIG2-like uncharacterized protein YtfP
MSTTCLGPASVPGRLYDLGEHPGAILNAPATHRIHGDVLQLPTDSGILDKLDRYEDYNPSDQAGSLFLRLRCEAELTDGRLIPCWIYVYNRDPGTAALVAHGDYARWCEDARDSPTSPGEISP